MGKAIMIQGTSSGVGKSLITMALCRHFVRKGLKVAPFKSQNMSLNSAVSVEGGEMARSQYVQAIASNTYPSVKMNPILIKPENKSSQIILLGKVYDRVKAKDYMNSTKSNLFEITIDSLKELLALNDIVIIEGAGSPAEINLKDKDIVNMKIAKAVSCPVILVSDIERGGAFAQVAGTMELLEKDEKRLIAGYIFNKFIGDPSLLEDYPQRLAKRYKMRFFGTMPYVHHKIPQEDSMIEWNKEGHGDVEVDIIKLPHISNFDDFDPLFWNAKARYVENGKLNADVIILPGTKTTLEDLKWLVNSGLADEIKRAQKRGAFIVGICGGYQMLGEEIEDPISGENERGLSILPVRTTIERDKRVSNLKGKTDLFGETVLIGYEIHHGTTHYTANVKQFLTVNEVNGKKINYISGAVRGNVFGTYLHGLFGNFRFTENFLNAVRKKKGLEPRSINSNSLIEEIDSFTDLFELNVDVKAIEEVVDI